MCLLERSERSHHRDPKNVLDKLLLETVALQSREGILPNHAGVKLTEKELQLHPQSLTRRPWKMMLGNGGELLNFQGGGISCAIALAPYTKIVSHISCFLKLSSKHQLWVTASTSNITKRTQHDSHHLQIPHPHRHEASKGRPWHGCKILRKEWSPKRLPIINRQPDKICSDLHFARWMPLFKAVEHEPYSAITYLITSENHPVCGLCLTKKKAKLPTPNGRVFEQTSPPPQGPPSHSISPLCITYTPAVFFRMPSAKTDTVRYTQGDEGGHWWSATSMD